MARSIGAHVVHNQLENFLKDLKVGPKNNA